MKKIIHANNINYLKTLKDNSVDSVVTDPPYGISFMGKKWDYDVPSVELWQEVYRVLKPGGHMLVACGTRTQHRMAVNIEDGGFEIRDIVAWVYGSGFPKSMDVSKAIDKNKSLSKIETKEFGDYIKKRRMELKLTQKEVDDYVCGGSTNYSFFEGRKNQQRMPSKDEYLKIKEILKLDDEWDEFIGEAEREVIDTHIRTKNSGGMPLQGTREKITIDITKPSTEQAKQWEGWGTALKPSMELWTLARKPLDGTVAQNILEYGVGGINIDGCRVETDDDIGARYDSSFQEGNSQFVSETATKSGKRMNIKKPDNINLGRFPANFLHDGSDEVEALFPETNPSSSGGISSGRNFGQNYENDNKKQLLRTGHDDNGGSASRFFYVAKASQEERNFGLYDFEEKFTASAEFRPNHMEKAIEGESGNPYGRWQPKKNIHPTVKPIELMRYLVRMITPPDGICLDPYLGSGTTAIACEMEKFNYIGIELDEQYIEIAKARVAAVKDYETSLDTKTIIKESIKEDKEKELGIQTIFDLLGDD